MYKRQQQEGAQTEEGPAEEVEAEGEGEEGPDGAPRPGGEGEGLAEGTKVVVVGRW